MAVHHTLGGAGGARGGGQHAHVVGRHCTGSWGGCGPSSIDDVPADPPDPGATSRVRPKPGCPKPGCRSAGAASHNQVQLQIRQLVRAGAVDDVEVVDMAVAVGRHIGPGAALGQDEPHLLVAVDVHDGHEHVAAHGQAVEGHHRLTPVGQLEGNHGSGRQSGPGQHADESESIGPDLGVGAMPRPRLRRDVDRGFGSCPQGTVDERTERLVGPPSLGPVPLPEKPPAPAGPATSCGDSCLPLSCRSAGLRYPPWCPWCASGSGPLRPSSWPGCCGPAPTRHDPPTAHARHRRWPGRAGHG